MTGAVLKDQAARDRIRDDLDTTLVVEAAAGTGKTTALVGRILSLIKSGRTRLENIVAVTFTEAAAGEMKLRLRSKIEEERAEAAPDVAGRLEVALNDLERARIATIHALCLDILKERPVEAGVDPLFEVAPDADARRLFDRVFETWFQEKLEDSPEGIRRLLRRRVWDDSPRERLRGAGWDLVERRDFPGAWRRDPLDREAALDDIVEAMREVASLCDKAKDKEDRLYKSVKTIADWLADLDHRESVQERDHDGLEVGLRGFAKWYHWKHKGWPSKFGEDRDDVLQRRDALKQRIDDVVARCDADLAACLHEDLAPLVQRYEEAKARAGRLDFLDLLLKARELLTRDADVRHELQERFTHLLVDEFQDTDPLQAEIVLLLAAAHPDMDDPASVRVAPGKLFLVGDPKQSIYRFRRADVQVYLKLKERLAADDAAVLHLSTSFRSDPRIQQVVNAAFEPIMNGGAQAEYVPLQPHREIVAERPAVIALPNPKPYSEWGRVTQQSMEVPTPGLVAGWVEWLLDESGWKVADPATGEMVPVESRHVCLLFRRFRSWKSSVVGPYTRALEARRIGHVLLGGWSFHEREEVIAMRTALTAIEWPDDELSVFATLRGPLFAVGDDALLAWRAAHDRLHPLFVPEDVEGKEELDEVAGALRVLRRLHLRRNRRPIAETISDLLRAVRAHAGLALWMAGEQVLANVLKLAEVARRFEARGASSFRAFVDRLDEDAARGEASEAMVVEEGTEGVRIMTVHKSKGLEFPVVVLCDVAMSATREDPSRWIDEENRAWYAPLAGCAPVELLENADEARARDAEEIERLLYVAATRARDILAVPAIGDEPDGEVMDAWWSGPVLRKLYPPMNERGEAAEAPGCPRFGKESVVERPGRAQAVGPEVRPGRHAHGSTDIVWWDPHTLHHDVQETYGLRRQEVLQADEKQMSAQRSIDRHAAWRDRRAAVTAEASAPTTVLRSPSEKGRDAGKIEVAWAETDTDRRTRPGGRRFGTLVHGVLAEVALDATDEEVAAMVRLQARLLGAPPGEVTAAAPAVRAALDHPLLVAARESPDARREAPVVEVLDERTLVEGTVDLVYRALEDDAWIVVEFKTTTNPTDEDRADYRAQVECYASAVTRATGEPTRGHVLLV